MVYKPKGGYKKIFKSKVVFLTAYAKTPNLKHKSDQDHWSYNGRHIMSKQCPNNRKSERMQTGRNTIINIVIDKDESSQIDFKPMQHKSNFSDDPIWKLVNSKKLEFRKNIYNGQFRQFEIVYPNSLIIADTAQLGPEHMWSVRQW